MLDATKRQALVDRLKNRVKKASSNVSTKVEAQKGDFRIVISSTSIDHFYKNNCVGSIKVAELDDGDLEFINADPQDAAQEMLTELSASFDVDEFEKTASKQVKKQAAHSTQDEKTLDMITQKQFDDQKPSLHPRTDEFYTNVTQKQLPEHGQRPGTFEVVTQGQLRDERTTFYGAERTTGDWKQEDRNLITEGQFESGVDTYTEVGESDRGEIGAKYDGELEQQWRQIGEKQLMELLRHHKWEEPLTITEGKEQLGQQDGELSRLTAEIAKKILKEATDALGKTVLSVGITPAELSGIVNRLVSHETKFPALANTIGLYSKADVSVIEKKVAKAKEFGKTANTGQDWSEFLAADVLVRQLSKISYKPQFVVDVLRALAENSDTSEKIRLAADEILNRKEAEEEKDNLSIIREALVGKPDVLVAGDDSDGRYEYKGTIAEVDADPSDKKKFSAAAVEHSKKQVLAQVENKDISLDPQAIDVNVDQGTFVVQFQDESKENQNLAARAERRRNIVKEATTKKADIGTGPMCPDCKKPLKHPAGENNPEWSCQCNTTASTKTAQMGGAGGMPPAAGPEMGNPAPPPGGGDMGAAPPGEALSQEPPLDPADEMGSGEPKPPGTICPVCGNEDVDIDNGEFRCNNCGGAGTIHVNLEVDKWPDTIVENDDAEQGGFGLGDGGLGAEEEGMDMGMGGMGEGEGTTMPNVPVGASVRLTGRMLEKLASQKITLGSVCPSCGSNNSELSKSASKGKNGVCWDCLQEYNFQLKANKNTKAVFAQYIWAPVKIAECRGCNRLKESFRTSLENYGVKWNDFMGMYSTDQAQLSLKMAKGGWLNLKSAMSEPLPIKKIAASQRWRDYNKFDKFPKASCIERIARRYGENATSMSGPCQGMNLGDCVCGQLENLGIYTDGLAAKVAARQASPDPRINSPMKECIAMFVRDHSYGVDDACTACDALRAAYSSTEDILLEAIAQVVPNRMPRTKPAMPGAVRDPATVSPLSPGAPAKPLGPAKPMSGPGMAGAAPAAPADALLSPVPGGMPGQPGGMPGGMPGEMPGGMPGAKPMMGPSGPGAAPAQAPGAEMGMPNQEMGPEGMSGAVGDMPGVPGMPEAKPMGDMGGMAPMEEPVSDFGDGGAAVELEIGGEVPGMGGDLMGDEMGGDMMGGDMGGDLMGDEMGGDLDLGGEGGTVNLIVDKLEELIQILQGGEIGGDMIEDDVLDMGDVTDGTVDGDELDDSEGGDDAFDETVGDEDSSDFGDSDIPGLVDDDHDDHGDHDHEDDGEMRKKKMMHRDEHDEDPELHKESEPMDLAAKSTEKVVEAETTEPVEATAEGSMDKQASRLDDMLFNMKRGTIKKSQNALDSLFDGLMGQIKLAKDDNDVKKMNRKPAGVGSKIKQTPAQDTEGIGKYRDGGKMGHEEAFNSGVTETPDVPRAQATLGDEGAEVTISETGDLPTVPAGSPAMAGEEHYRPEKGTQVDGNQGGGQTTSAKSEKTVKTAQRNGEQDMKTAKTWTVAPDHKYYGAFMKRADSGKNDVELKDGITYDMLMDQNKNILLVAKNCGMPMEIQEDEKDDEKDCKSCKKPLKACGCAKTQSKIKESQTVTPKSVEKLEDDPDLNPSSGPGAGKTHGDEKHSLGIDEKKPSEGMNEPSVPEAPNSGQLGREHTVTNELGDPEIPAGGGMHPDYDQNDKNEPEKQDQTLGKENDIAAMASVSHDDAVKVASQMLKANLISIDDLPTKVAELKRATPESLEDIRKLLNNTNKGLRRQASAGSVETAFVQKSAARDEENLTNNIQGLFKLDKQNRDYDKLSGERGDARLWH